MLKGVHVVVVAVVVAAGTLAKQPDDPSSNPVGKVLKRKRMYSLFGFLG